METTSAITTLPLPLTRWEDGTIRVNDTRVTLDVIVHQFKLGDTAEQIQDSFPSLKLRDVYGVIYYYLEQTEEVEKYLEQQKQAEEATRQFIESQPETAAFRERIRARRRQLLAA